jgi:hypothetical protein
LARDGQPAFRGAKSDPAELFRAVEHLGRAAFDDRVDLLDRQAYARAMSRSGLRLAIARTIA